MVISLLLLYFLHGSCAWTPPAPNYRQAQFMELETIQFMHFGIPTFWDPPTDFLYTDNPTYHDCKTTSIDHGAQTDGFYPCLRPDVFAPSALDTDDWMRQSVAMGMKEICLTAHHEGGFALWPSKHTNYSVAASAWRGGSGDVLREFADAANRWGVKICYYLNVAADGYQTLVAKATPDEFIERQMGMLQEVMAEYGPVHRFWFDGTQISPAGTDMTKLWAMTYATIRSQSPDTLISPYRGDVCTTIGSLYTGSGPAPNSTESGKCPKRSENGTNFYPNELHGITMQMGPDGNTGETPTYWFWHPWACAKNVTGCPWVGHGNASRIFDSYLVTVGHGAVLNMNIPPDRTGKMNESVAAVMTTVGKAINDTFHRSVAKIVNQSAPCVEQLALLELEAGSTFDYVVTMEDLSSGQRISNYSIQYQQRGSSVWETLIPAVIKNTSATARVAAEQAWFKKKGVQHPTLGDRPDGHDPRDQYIGHKRIDFPVVHTSGPAAVDVARVRFNCISSLADPVTIRSLSLHKRTVPWD